MRVRYRGTPNARRLVSPRTDIVIEGFPRCANSFAVRAFRMDNDPEGEMRIATHFHSPAQVSLGVQWGIPALVLTRPPDDAVVSFPALAMQLDKHGFAAATDDVLRRHVRYWTRRYIQFHRPLLPLRDRVVIADFAQTTSDFGAVVRRLNARFGTAFTPFAHTEANAKAIYENSRIREHLYPSPVRNEMKENFRVFFDGPENNAERQRAFAAYRAILGAGETVR